MRRASIGMMILALGATLQAAHAAEAEISRGSAFAVAVFKGASSSDAVLAQRSISRDWGVSDESTYVEVEVPRWRGEATALALSAIVPGSGQIYAGDKRGVLFALGEALGWFEVWYLQRRGRELKNEAFAFAGNPADSLSRWSFSHYEQRTGKSSDQLKQLYAADRDLFYYLISRDASYTPGWADDSNGSRGDRRRYLGIHEDSEVRYKGSRYFQAALMVNHILAALDAMHVARIHNLSIAPRLGLDLKVHGRAGAPGLSAALVRRF